MYKRQVSGLELVKSCVSLRGKFCVRFSVDSGRVSVRATDSGRVRGRSTNSGRISVRIHQ